MGQTQPCINSGKESSKSRGKNTCEGPNVGMGLGHLSDR